MLAADTKVAARFTAPLPGLLGKLTAYLDGLGSGHGVAKLKAIVYYSSTGSYANQFIGVSDEVQIASGAPAEWVDFRFSQPGGLYLPQAYDYDFGLLVGGTSNVARAFTEPNTLGRRNNADVYADGPSNPFGSAAFQATDLAIYGIAVGKYAPPTIGVDEFYYARLPFADAQQKFMETAPIRKTALPARLTWHGTGVDVERGSFAVVQLNGRFNDWIGERIRITSWQQKGLPASSVRCFVHNYAELDSDLSVPRRVWAALAPLGMDSLDVTVERLA
jgi:hypothetical protein